MIGREGERVRSYVSSIMSEGTINGDKVLKMKLFALMIWLDILIRRRIIDKYYIDCSLLNGFCKLFLLCDVTSFELILIFILNVYTMFHFSLFEPVTFPRIKKDAYIYIYTCTYMYVFHGKLRKCIKMLLETPMSENLAPNLYRNHLYSSFIYQ